MLVSLSRPRCRAWCTAIRQAAAVVVPGLLSYMESVLSNTSTRMARLQYDAKSRSSAGLAATATAIAIVIAALACTESTLDPLPLEISIAASRTTAAPGDTIYFVATIQGGSILGLNADYGDTSTDIFGTSGARTGKVTFRHAYTTRGTFTTKITLTDATLGTKSDSIQIRVN